MTPFGFVERGGGGPAADADAGAPDLGRSEEAVACWGDEDIYKVTSLSLSRLSTLF